MYERTRRVNFGEGSIAEIFREQFFSIFHIAHALLFFNAIKIVTTF